MTELDPGAITAEAMICRYAELNDSGLTIIGAGASRIPIPPQQPQTISLWLALLVHVPYTRTNENHLLSIELVSDMPTEAGPSQRIPINLREQGAMPEEMRGRMYMNVNVGRPAYMKPGDDTIVPFALPIHQKEVPGPGHYYFKVCIDDAAETIARVSFDIDVVQMVGFVSS